MNEAVQFGLELACIYDETRPLDSQVCRTGFRDALQSILGRKDARIVDVGCGTGRILECLVPDLFRSDQVVGIDISPAMIGMARSKPVLREVEFHTVPAVVYANSVVNQKHFDAVICHWLCHCVPDWQRVFRSCVDLAKSNGVLIWLEEDGDLYQALDGVHTSNEPLARLFNAYFEAVNTELLVLGLDSISPSSRLGTLLRCTPNLANELATWGWNVRRNFQTHRWTRQVTVNWVIETILKRRAFTNLRQIPNTVNVQAIKILTRKLGHEGLPSATVSVELTFWAKPVIAAFAASGAFDSEFCDLISAEQS